MKKEIEVGGIYQYKKTKLEILDLFETVGDGMAVTVYVIKNDPRHKWPEGETAQTSVYVIRKSFRRIKT